MTLSESREDYLENLLILETRSGGFVRQVDMASRMGFSKASISKAMSSLSAEGYVEFRPRGLVRLSNGRLNFQRGDAKSLKEFTTAIASSSRFLPTLAFRLKLHKGMPVAWSTQ